MANTKVTSNVIADDAITTAKIADDAVGSDQLASGLTLGGNTAATLSTAAQPNITSVGTLTGLTTGAVSITSGNGDQLLLNNAGERFTQISLQENSTTRGALWVDGTDNSVDLYAGTSHGIRFKTGGDNPRVTITDGGNVGIGATTVDELLHLEKSSGSTIVKTEVAANSTVGFEIAKTGSTTQRWRIVDGQTVNGKLEFYDVTDSRSVMTFDGSGNVGIGESSPDKLLHLKSSGTTGIAIESTTNAQDLDIDFYNNSGSAAGRIRYSEGTGTLNLSGNVTGTGLTVSWSNNVGIGDIDPFSKLHVEDTGWSSGAPYGTVAYIEGGAVNDLNWGHLVVSQSGTTTDTGGRISLGANGQNPIAGIRAKYKGATYGDLALLTRPSGGTNTERVTITSAGNVGINNDSPAHRLHIQGDTNDLSRVRVTNTSTGQASLDLNNTEGYFRTYTDGGEYRIYDQTDGTHRIILDTSGNFLVAKSASDSGVVGFEARATGETFATAAGTAPLYAKRNTDDGDVVIVQSASGTVGRLAVNGGAFVVKGSSASAPVQLQTHDGNEDIEVDPDGFIKMETAGSERLRIDQYGTLELKVPDSATTLKLTPSGTNANATLDFNTPGSGSGLIKVQGTTAITIASNQKATFSSLTEFQDQMTINNADGGPTVYSESTGIISGSGQKAKMIEGVYAYNTVSAGNTLTIPVTDQSSVWHQYLAEFRFVTGEYNANAASKAGTLKIGFTSLNGGPVNFVELEKTGNVSSYSGTDSNLLIEFTSAYNAGLNDYEGVICYYRILGYNPHYLQMWNGALD